MSTTGRTGDLQALTNELDQHHDELRQRLTDVDAVTLRQSAGGWSVQQHIEHMARLENLWAQRVDDLLNERLLRQLDTKETPTSASGDMDQASLLDNLCKMRAALVVLISSLTDADREKTAGHPWNTRPIDLSGLLGMIRDSDARSVERVNAALRRLQ